jgi:phage-related tail fiber protein
MKRIDTATKAVDLFGAGKHGFRDGDLGLGVVPTDLDAVFFNDLQEEVVGIIESAGLTPTAGVRNQLWQAIQIMIAASVVQDYKASVRYTTTANIALSGLGTQAGGDWPSALTAGDRIFAKDQTTGSQNFIYIAAAGAWTRATDADGTGEITSGAVVLVEEGTALADTQWMLTTDGPITIGTTALTFARKDAGAAVGLNPGDIVYTASKTPSPGTLKANGAAVSRTTYAALFAAIYKSSTVTMTIAAPAVIACTGFTPSPNDPVELTNSGVLPTGFVTATKYYVVGASIVPGVSYQLSATPGGTAITTTGSQSGVHTAHNAPFGIGDGSTTFNVPDLRGEFIRGWDNARGADTNRAFGISQLDQVQGHKHSITGSAANVTGGGANDFSHGDFPNVNVTVNTNASLISDDTNGTPRAGTETRPRNIALLACIKF